jgi:uncharacterized protein (TIGR03790 family)
MKHSVRLICRIAVFLFVAAAPAFALDPDQILIIVNSAQPDGSRIAQLYCSQRHVPAENIMALPMTNRLSIPQAFYAQQIAPIIRDRLNQPDLKGRIRCLLTVRGVPLKIESFELQGPSAAWRDLIVKLLDQRFSQLKRLTSDFRILADLSPTPSSQGAAADTAFKLPRIRLQRDATALQMLHDATQAAEKAQAFLRAESPTALGHDRKLQKLDVFAQEFGGLELRVRSLRPLLSTDSKDSRHDELSRQFDAANAQLQQLADDIRKIDQSPLDLAAQQRRYDAIYTAGGLNMLCQALLNDRYRLDDEESSAAFDSELSLVLWPPYRLTGWQYNDLRAYPDDVPRPSSMPKRDESTLMVSRVDGPSLDVAQGLIDKAVAAERDVLRGAAYIDARGIFADRDKFGSFGFFDEALRKTAALLRQTTSLKVVLDDKESLFTPGACPDATLYCGWYKLRNYVDSFQFNLGAVGYHIASFEAETLGADDPNSNVWCKRMLEKGITATLGPVDEPYLTGFIRPDLFFAELTAGKYTLVECYYHVNPFNSWRLILIGDPLYRPRFTQSVGFQPRF